MFSFNEISKLKIKEKHLEERINQLQDNINILEQQSQIKDIYVYENTLNSNDNDSSHHKINIGSGLIEDIQIQVVEENQHEETIIIESNLEPLIQSSDILTASKGVNYYNNNKETYYNLDMSGCISIMRDMGNTDEYWIREDGVKMLGSYVMCAANLNIHPRGSLVETSLGTAIVVDTGEFANNNPNQIDIAVTW